MTNLKRALILIGVLFTCHAMAATQECLDICKADYKKITSKQCVKICDGVDAKIAREKAQNATAFAPDPQATPFKYTDYACQSACLKQGSSVGFCNSKCSYEDQ